MEFWIDFIFKPLRISIQILFRFGKCLVQWFYPGFNLINNLHGLSFGVNIKREVSQLIFPFKAMHKNKNDNHVSQKIKNNNCVKFALSFSPFQIFLK
jgi:hypothetical protein